MNRERKFLTNTIWNCSKRWSFNSITRKIPQCIAATQPPKTRPIPILSGMLPSSDGRYYYLLKFYRHVLFVTLHLLQSEPSKYRDGFVHPAIEYVTDPIISIDCIFFREIRKLVCFCFSTKMSSGCVSWYESEQQFSTRWSWTLWLHTPSSARLLQEHTHQQTICVISAIALKWNTLNKLTASLICMYVHLVEWQDAAMNITKICVRLHARLLLEPHKVLDGQKTTPASCLVLIKAE